MHKLPVLLLCVLFLVSCSGDSPVDTPSGTQPDLVWKDLRAVPSAGSLYDIWGDAAGTVVAVGAAATALHRDGDAWIPFNSYSLAFRVWGTSADNVYGVGFRPLHFDGSTWSPVDLNTNVNFYAVRGSSPVDVYFGGEDGAVVHYDGASGTTIDAGITTTVWDVWSNGPDDVYLVSEDIVHFNGTAWEVVDPGDPAIHQSVRCVASASPDNVLVSGFKTTFFNGTSWTTIPHGNFYFTKMWCNGPDDYYAAHRNRVMRFDGRAWSVLFELPAGSNLLNSVWGDPETAMYAVGSGGEIWLYRGGEPELLNQTTDDIVALWAASENDVHIATYREGLFHFDGHTWEKQDIPVSVGTQKKIWGTEKDNVFATDGGSLYHFNGNEWTELALEQQIYPRDVWQAYDGTVFVVGDKGVGIYTGQRWWFLVGGPALDSVWGRNSSDVYAASSDGTLLHFDGTDWSVVQHEMGNIFDLWGCGGTVYAAAVTTLWMCREEEWGRAPGSPGFTVTGLWGTSESNIYLHSVGDPIYHYDGSAYEEMYRGVATTVYTIWGTSSTSVYAGGARGLLLHYGPYGD